MYRPPRRVALIALPLVAAAPGEEARIRYVIIDAVTGALTTLVNFNRSTAGPNGATAYSGLLIDAVGNLFGSRGTVRCRTARPAAAPCSGLMRAPTPSPRW